MKQIPHPLPIPDNDLNSIDRNFAELKDNSELLIDFPISYRKEQIKSLLNAIKESEGEVIEASWNDLGQDPSAGYITQISSIYSEGEYILNNLTTWSEVRIRDNTFLNDPSSLYVKPHPRGVFQVIGCWNIPFSLCLVPMIYAMSAGNCVQVKTSEYAPNLSSVITRIIKRSLNDKFYRVIEGGKETTKKQTKLKFDGIIFTGSTKQAKEIYQAASENFVPCIFECTSKIPCIVDSNCSLGYAAKRITNFKMQNCGQLYMNADYVLCHRMIYYKFVQKVIHNIRKGFILNYSEKEWDEWSTNNGVKKLEDWSESDSISHNQILKDDCSKVKNYSRMIHKKHTKKTWGLLENMKNNIVFQGGVPDFEQRFFPPTVVLDPGLNSDLMTKVINGPIIPIIPYTTVQECIEIINHPARDNPLTAYYYGESQSQFANQLSRFVKSGSFITNDCCVHYFAPGLPFGGVGNSGISTYHGIDGFNNCSHVKPYIVKPMIPLLDYMDFYQNPEYNPIITSAKLKNKHKKERYTNNRANKFCKEFCKLNCYLFHKYLCCCIKKNKIEYMHKVAPK